MTRRIPLDLNESYWLLDEETYADAVRGARLSCTTYPDYKRLTEALASYLAVPTASIVLAPGSDAAIEGIMAYCVAQGMRALLPLPTFSGYEHVLSYTPLPVQMPCYREEDGGFRFPIAEVRTAIEQRTADVVFLCEPNNPLGCALPQEEYEMLLDTAREHDVLVVLDEAYAEYGGRSAVERIGSQPLVILRTFSKGLGVPGIRLGCAIASPDRATNLRDFVFGRLPWPIPGITVAIALELLACAVHMEARRELLVRQRTLFSAELAALPGVHVFPSVTNFVLARVPRAKDLVSALGEEGIAAALGASKTQEEAARRLLHDTVRFSVPSPEDHDIVLSCVHRALALS